MSSFFERDEDRPIPSGTFPLIALYLHKLALLLWLSLDEVRLGYVQFVHELFISSDVRIQE